MSTERPITKIDLHMHTRISDGTDSPAEIISNVKKAGVDLFSVTDHDAVMACGEILRLLKNEDLLFIPGVEFSCKDEQGEYHILGYGYDPIAPVILEFVRKGHDRRIEKIGKRLEKLRNEYGIRFPDEEIAKLYTYNNPGKPHLANLMVKYGVVKTREMAFEKYLTQLKVPGSSFRPEEAITAILAGGGIPVLAHPSLGNGDDRIVGDEMDARLQRLVFFGLKGVEAFYSGLTQDMRAEMLYFAEKYDLYVTAGSDYHGKNKTIAIGDTHLKSVQEAPDRLRRFLGDVRIFRGKH